MGWISLLAADFPFLATHSHTEWRSSTMSMSTTRKSMCRSRRSFLRERAIATLLSSNQSSASSFMWVFSHLLFTEALLRLLWCSVKKEFITVKTNESFCSPSLPHQLSLVFTEFPMLFVLNGYLQSSQHVLANVHKCGKVTQLFTSLNEWFQKNKARTIVKDPVHFILHLNQ